MNERIRLLAELADKAIRETDLREVNGGIHITPAFVKFAELIVQECLNQCYNRGMDDELYAGQLKAATYIEEYFGVKE